MVLRFTSLFKLFFIAVFIATFATYRFFGELQLRSKTRTISGFVSLCPARMNGNHRTGDHLFMLSAMLYVAHRTNREVIMKETGWCVDDTFRVKFVRRNISGLPYPVRILNPPEIYNSDPSFNGKEMLNITERTLALCGLYQTYLYADVVGPMLRSILLPRPQAVREAELFFEFNRPVNWKPGTYIRVGIHIGRGDLLSASEQDWGLSFDCEHYLKNSMNYFLSRYDRVQFIVATDNHERTKKALVRQFINASAAVEDTLEIYRHLFISNSSVATFSVGHTTASDVIILTACDASIISIGSFSWWIGWLTNKTTIYYANWPLGGSTYHTQPNPATYYPSRWIPMT